MDKMDPEGAVGANRMLGLHCARLNGRQVVLSFFNFSICKLECFDLIPTPIYLESHRDCLVQISHVND